MRNGGVWQVASGATVGRADSRAAEGEGGGIAVADDAVAVAAVAVAVAKRVGG